MKKLIVLLFGCVTFTVCLQATPPQDPVVIGSTLTTFSVLAGSTVVNYAGYTTVNGNLGVSAGTAVVGFPPGSVTGTIYTGAGSLAGTAQGQLTTAINDAASRTGFTTVATLDGLHLTPGLFRSSSTMDLSVGAKVYLTGAADSVFIFQVGSALNIGNGGQVILAGGVTAANIFWQVGSSATLGTTAVFEGTILAYASITLNTGASLAGRALAQTGAVNLDTNAIVNPGPAILPGHTPPALSGFTCPVGVALVGVPYSSLVVPIGGTPDYTFSVTTPLLLPPGSPAFSLDPSTGDLTGTPTGVTQSYTFGVSVTDSLSVTVSGSCTIAVTAAGDQADVSILKTGPTTAAPHTSITYSILVRNLGPASAAAVTVTDLLPAGTTFVSATSPCSASLGTVTCSLGTMLSGGSTTITLVVTSPSGGYGSVVNTAVVVSTTPDPVSANNSSTATVTVTTPSIPTLSTWGLALLALLLLLAGCSVLFSRKAHL